MAIGGGGNYPGVSAFNAQHGLGGGTVNAGINVTANTQQAHAAFQRLQGAIGNFASRVQSSVNRSIRSFSDLDLHVRRINGNIVAMGFAFYGVARQAEAFVQRGAKMELFQKRMEGVSGSVQDAAVDMAKIIETAQNVPFKLEAVTRAFIKLKSAGIEPITDSQGNGPLKSMLDAMAAFGGDSEQLDRAIIAITQMAGKGTVSMEELRQQLGESIPTAMRIAAREMKMTVGEFIKDVSKGKISWEEFADVFFKGLDKNYAGRAAALMNTFTGSVQQLDTQFDILAKTVFVDTGTMRYFTAAVQLATDKMKELGAFLQTPKGQRWVESLWEDFKQLARFAGEAEKPIRAAITVIGTIGTAVASLTGSLPAAVINGGILGYVFFGKAGVVPGALLGAFAPQIQGVATAVAEFIKTVDAKFESVAPGSIAGAAAIGGYLGYRIAGPYGALAGAIAGALSQAMPAIETFLGDVERQFMIFQRQRELTSWSDFFDPAKMHENMMQATQEVDEALDKMRRATEANPIELKVDLEGGSSTENVLQSIQQKADAMKDALANTLENISAETAVASAKITTNIGNFTSSFANKDEAVSQLTDYQTAIIAKMDEINVAFQQAALKQNEAMSAGNIGLADKYSAEMKQLQSMLSETEQLYAETGARIKEIKLMPDIAVQADSYLNSIRNFTSTIDTSFVSVDTMKQKLAEWSEGLVTLKANLDSSTLSVAQKAEISNVLAASEKELASAMELVSQKAESANAPLAQNAKAVAEVTRMVGDLETKGNRLTLGESFTGEAERIGAASDRIKDYLNDIAVAIEEIRNKQANGLISAETANAAIANLQAMANAAEGAKGKMIAAASDVGQAWTEMGRSIYSAIETSLGDAIYGLVTGTKSAKEVLLDLWNSVTRAVSNYLAKVIMASIFGGGMGGGGGGIFGSLFGSNQGSQLSFAQGGIVDGRTGFDNNVVSMRVSRGERVTVETAAQQNANRRNGGGFGDIHIHAMDGRSVRELFMREGSALQSSLNQRLRLNHQ